MLVVWVSVCVYFSFLSVLFFVLWLFLLVVFLRDQFRHALPDSATNYPLVREALVLRVKAPGDQGQAAARPLDFRNTGFQARHQLRAA